MFRMASFLHRSFECSRSGEIHHGHISQQNKTQGHQLTIVEILICFAEYKYGFIIGTWFVFSAKSARADILVQSAGHSGSGVGETPSTSVGIITSSS
jgi:hypothetical protein